MTTTPAMKATINRDFQVGERVRFVFRYGPVAIYGTVSATNNDPFNGPSVRVTTDGKDLPTTGWYSARYWRTEETES